MKKAYLGIDVHKEQNILALAFAGRGDLELSGKAPADLDAFVRVLRRVLAKYGLEKADVAIGYEAGAIRSCRGDHRPLCMPSAVCWCNGSPGQVG